MYRDRLAVLEMKPYDCVIATYTQCQSAGAAPTVVQGG